jgi:hypothetical protein
MCPSCIPALPALAGALSGGGLIMGLSGLLARLLHNVSRLKKYSFLIQ